MRFDKLLHSIFWLLLVALICGCSLLPPPSERGAQGERAPTAQGAPRRVTATPAPPVAAIPGFGTVTPDELPREARRTLELIAQGGPFPYRQDGTVFQNRERLLPRKERGYYREYTVRTPGEDDRGARRLVVGAGGEIFYTDDHYASFVQVLPQ